MEKILTDKNICISNSGASTRIGYNSESAIDVTLCTATLTPIMDWTVSTSPGDSDPCPIHIAIMKQNLLNDTQITYLNYKRADWTKYTNDESWKNFPDVATVENEQLIIDLYNRFHQAIDNPEPLNI